MTLKPGETRDLSMEFMMHPGMEGVHDFRVHVKSNDPDQPELVLAVLSDWEA
jgi:hypothetical protein